MPYCLVEFGGGEVASSAVVRTFFAAYFQCKFTMHSITKSKLLESQEWYIGLLPRTAVECYLKKEGDFVVRTCEKGGALEFVVSVRGPVKCAHYTVFYEDGAGWGLNLDSKNTFPSVVDLVSYYHKHILPGCGLLRHPVKRPHWYLKHEHLSYNVKKDCLGSGNFCDVYKGRLNITKSVAIKICHGPNGDKKQEDLQNCEKAKESLIKEGSLMATYRNPNIIKFYGICCDRPPVCVVMERCYGGSLLGHLSKFGTDITTGERVRYCLEAAKGMCYLQDRNCIHRDLAARNCLISKYGVIKIADFGLSKVVTELAGEKFENQEVPVRWMAPETLRRDPEYSIKSDVWAYGMLLYEIYDNGTKPWPLWEPKRIATHIRKGRMPDLHERTPTSVKELVKECWSLNVEKRCDFKYIFKRMSDVQLKLPAPRPEKSTIARIPRVTAMSMAEMDVLQEADDSDEALDDAASSSEELHNDDPEREATIEEVAVKRTPKKKKKPRAGDKKKKDRKPRKSSTPEPSGATVLTISEDTNTERSKAASEDTDSKHPVKAVKEEPSTVSTSNVEKRTQPAAKRKKAARKGN